MAEVYLRRVSHPLIVDADITVYYEEGTSQINNYTITKTGNYEYYPQGSVITSFCTTGSTTETVIRGLDAQPYAEFTTLPNSVNCGYVPPPCDLTFKATPNITDETATGANDGTLQAFASSGFKIISYNLNSTSGGANYSSNNGMFTQLPPGTYTLTAYDANNCSTSTAVQVHAYDVNATHLKYKFEFEDINGDYLNRVEFHNMKLNYNSTEYPKAISEGDTKPLVYKQALQSEDKTEVFAPSSITVNLLAGDVFTVEEFALADERTWFVKWYQGEILRFQGWLLPDEVKDEYDDAPYTVSFVATDGLLSLKGADFNGTGILQQFGVTRFNTILKACLNQLGYDYGNYSIIKSLYHNGEMIWPNVGIWWDIFYDEDGTPDDAYTALQRLLNAFKLVILQHNGHFVLVDYSVFYSRNSVSKQNDYKNLFKEYDSNDNQVATYPAVVQPVELAIGDEQALQPIGGSHGLNYDRSFKKVIAKIDFNLLAVLFNNPSFELGAVKGALPLGFSSEAGGIPGSGLTNDDSYIGDFSFKLRGAGYVNGNLGETPKGFIDNDQPFIINENNKKIKFSFNWKAPDVNFYYGNKPEENKIGLVPGVSLYFRRKPDNKAFFLQPSPYKATAYPNFANAGYNQSEAPFWQPVNTGAAGEEVYDEGELVSIKPDPTSDYIGWQSYSIESPPLPGTGELYLRFCGTRGIAYNPVITAGQGQSGDVSDKIYFNVPNDQAYYTLIDNVQITQDDATESYNKQIGETHTVTNLSNYAKAENKTVNIDLFTSATNKRLAGNVFYLADFVNGIVDYQWHDPMQSIDLKDRLTAIIVRQIARSLQRPMYKFEGPLATSFVNMYSIFSLQFYENRMFIPYSVELDVRDAEANVVLVETDDSDFANSYTYVAKFEKNARRVRN